MMEQTIEEFSGTKNITIGGGSSDVEAGIEFIYNMREHLLDIGIATIFRRGDARGANRCHSSN